jgi:hypothetical protein
MNTPSEEDTLAHFEAWWAQLVRQHRDSDVPSEWWYVAGYWHGVRRSPREYGNFADAERTKYWHMGYDDAEGDLS